MQICRLCNDTSATTGSQMSSCCVPFLTFLNRSRWDPSISQQASQNVFSRVPCCRSHALIVQPPIAPDPSLKARTSRPIRPPKNLVAPTCPALCLQNGASWLTWHFSPFSQNKPSTLAPGLHPPAAEMAGHTKPPPRPGEGAPRVRPRGGGWGQEGGLAGWGGVVPLLPPDANSPQPSPSASCTCTLACSPHVKPVPTRCV